MQYMLESFFFDYWSEQFYDFLCARTITYSVVLLCKICHRISERVKEVSYKNCVILLR